MEKNIMEEFEKDLIVYKKNEETIKSILALIEYRQKVDKEKEEIGNTAILDILFDRIIANLSDKDVKISYKGKADDLTVMLYTMIRDLYIKYEGKIDTYYLDQVDLVNYTSKIWNCEYNLIKYALDRVSSWRKSYEMIFSDIPVEIRCEMFNDFLSFADADLLRDVLITNEFKNKKFLELKEYGFKKIDNLSREIKGI